jgi:uncharacterized protein DUF397
MHRNERQGITGARWRKSSFSGGSGSGNDSCVEVALVSHAAALRDSKNVDGPVLHLPTAAWHALVNSAK